MLKEINPDTNPNCQSCRVRKPWTYHGEPHYSCPIKEGRTVLQSQLPQTCPQCPPSPSIEVK